MDKRMMDIYDIVALILVLAVFVPMGVIVTVRDYNEVKNYEANYEDKTANATYSPTYKIYGEYDGTLTKEEAILVSQIQDPGMTDQTKIRYRSLSQDKKTYAGEYELNVGTETRENADSVTGAIADLFRNDDPEYRGYRIVYNNNDGTYEIRQDKKNS